MAKYSSLSRKVYGGILVVMLFISVLESAECDSTTVTTEVALPDVKNPQVQATEIGSIKTVARRGSPGRSTNGVGRASTAVPALLTSAVLIFIVNMAAIVS